MSEENINLTAPIHAATQQGKAVAAREVFMDGDKETVQQIGEKTHQLEDAIKDITVSGGASTANAVSYSNETSGMTAVTAQGAIDELATKNTSQDAEIAKKFNLENISQESGGAEDKVMSQKAVSTKLNDLLLKLLKLLNILQDDGDKRFQIVDENNNVGFEVDNNGARCKSYSVVDNDGNVVLKINEKLKTLIDNILLILQDDGDKRFQIVDENNNVGFEVDNNGARCKSYSVVDNDGNVVLKIDENSNFSTNKILSVNFENGYRVNKNAIGGGEKYKHTELIPVTKLIGAKIHNAIHNQGLPAIVICNSNEDRLDGLYVGNSEDIESFDFLFTEEDYARAKNVSANFAWINLAKNGYIEYSLETIIEQFYNFRYCDNLLVMADNYPIVLGNKLELFLTSLIPQSYSTLGFQAVNIETENTDTLKAGRFRENAYVFEASVSRNKKVKITFLLKDPFGNIVGEQVTNVVPIVKKQSPDSPIDILTIGDSYTHIGAYLHELNRRLTGTGGSPISDNLSNINFIGTIRTEKGDKCEGYSGWKYSDFVKSGSPFYIDGKLDISKYISNNSLAKIDAVLILLGANELSSEEDIRTLLDSFISYNSSIKIVVASNAMNYNNYGWSDSRGLSAGVNFNNNYLKIINWNRKLKEICSSYDRNILYIDVPSQIDTINNFDYEEVSANNRNSVVKVRQGIDNVHPAESGFMQISDAFYNAIHYYILK
jgi:hypothetical protein